MRPTLSAVVKERARAYAKRPSRLEVFLPGLAHASPPRLIAVGEMLLDRKLESPASAFAADISAINARAAILLGRYWQRIEKREAAQMGGFHSHRTTLGTLDPAAASRYGSAVSHL